MKSTAIGLTLVLFTSACSHKTENRGVTDTPKFQITASDVSSLSVQSGVIVKTGRKIAELDVVFSRGKTDWFHNFAQEHLNQKVQFLVGTNVILETTLNSATASGKLELSCSTIEEAQAIADSLTKND